MLKYHLAECMFENLKLTHLHPHFHSTMNAVLRQRG
jgi:hypothetical protein